MNSYQAAMEISRSMRAADHRDWLGHWTSMLAEPRLPDWRRRIALEALRNLGAPQRIPGEDDE